MADRVRVNRGRIARDRQSRRPLAARCHLGLGMLYRATGQPESAQHHLATAATMVRMDMRSWVEKATAEMDEGSR